MKKLRSSDNIRWCGEKSVVKDWGRKEGDSGSQQRTSSSSVQRGSRSYRMSDVSSSTPRYDQTEGDRESPKLVRKWSDYDLESHERRKTQDHRYRDGNERGVFPPPTRPAHGMDQMHRSESISGPPRKDFPKGLRSERDRPKREGIAASWRRFGGTNKDNDDGSWSGNETSRGTRMESKESGMSNSPKGGHRDVKSPAWSKDSGSERSKSVEGKKCEDMPVDSSGPSSEREEGELEPDPEPHVPLTNQQAVEDNEAAVESNFSQKDPNNDLCVETGDLNLVNICEKQAECELFSKGGEDDMNKSNDFPGCKDALLQKGGESRDDENEINDENECDNNVTEGGIEGSLEDVADSTCRDKLSLEVLEEERGVTAEKEVDVIVMTGNVEITAESDFPSAEHTTPTLKDKGKSVAILPSESVHFTETNFEAENNPWNLATNGDVEIEGPSTRGFQLFSDDPIKKTEKVEQLTNNKPKDDKLALDLSLSLPNVLQPFGYQNRGQAPGSPSHARSMQSFASSFRTNSDGFTASMSFSGSQQFTHNPSCSLTHNALDFEKSVKSKPLFQGVDWEALASEENKNKEVPAHQGMPSRENDLLNLSSQFQGKNSTGQAAVHNPRVTGGSSKPLPVALERQLSFNKHLSGTQSFGSYENGIERRQLVREKDSDGLRRSDDPDFAVGTDFAESISTMIVSEPIQAMARRFSYMTGKHRTCVKEFVLDIISNPGKQWQKSALQKALQKRSDVTLDMLLNAHPTQLEILVALKTGIQEFLLQKYEIPLTDLAEIFLNMRCRNLKCRSVLPVDECDCKICARQSDFCRECMCLVCSMFDMASNTCSWVGCDVCLHWCHSDCGLRESHIRNGQSATGSRGTTEIQFYCVACGHPSEMFGFVKEVFQSFLKEWTAENLSRELECVRRIFCLSEDLRGKQLHGIAIMMLSRLGNRADLQAVQNNIMRFFDETNPDRPGNNTSIEIRKELSTKNQEVRNATAGPSLGPGWLKPVYPDKPPHLENSVKSLPDFDTNRTNTNNNNKFMMNLDLQKIAQKEPVFDELESIVRIKQAEAKMFQSRAEDARRESEALKRIVVTKSERLEEEYTSQITKLRLTETEDMRKQKLEELQALDQAYQEYFNMKMRMEMDIKDLLLKMEATRRNLPA